MFTKKIATFDDDEKCFSQAHTLSTVLDFKTLILTVYLRNLRNSLCIILLNFMEISHTVADISQLFAFSSEM